MNSATAWGICDACRSDESPSRPSRDPSGVSDGGLEVELVRSDGAERVEEAFCEVCECEMSGRLDGDFRWRRSPAA